MDGNAPDAPQKYRYWKFPRVPPPHAEVRPQKQRIIFFTKRFFFKFLFLQCKFLGQLLPLPLTPNNLAVQASVLWLLQRPILFSVHHVNVTISLSWLSCTIVQPKLLNPSPYCNIMFTFLLELITQTMITPYKSNKWLIFLHSDILYDWTFFLTVHSFASNYD